MIELDASFRSCDDCSDMFDTLESPFSNRCSWCQRRRDIELERACSGVVQVEIHGDTTQRITRTELDGLLFDCDWNDRTTPVPMLTIAQEMGIA